MLQALTNYHVAYTVA